jgi:opacity protein-like surface antigen
MRSAYKRITMSVVAAALLLGALIPAAQAAPDGNVYVWEHVGAGGAGCKWGGDDRDYRYNTDCGNFNDRVSSAHNRGYSGAFEDVMFWEHTNYRGQSICLPNGAYWSSMARGWNDRVSSHKWGAFC